MNSSLQSDRIEDDNNRQLDGTVVKKLPRVLRQRSNQLDKKFKSHRRGRGVRLPWVVTSTALGGGHMIRTCRDYKHLEVCSCILT